MLAGFTLVEVMAVLCILALGLSGGMLMLSGALRKATGASFASDFLDAHDWACKHSEVSAAQLQLELDFSAQQIRVGTGGPVVDLPKSVQLERVLMGGAILEAGSVNVPYVRGKAPTYAVLFQLSNGRGKWFVVCGPTGQVKVIQDEQKTQADLSLWLAQWANAH